MYGDFPAKNISMIIIRVRGRAVHLREVQVAQVLEWEAVSKK